ncbi:MAG: hypothetical protein GY841_20580, partial [FCB group bacterium]|nr:hypothetical protein [FCB group bacterium]
MRQVTEGKTSYITHIFIQDSSSSTGAGLASLDNTKVSIYWIQPGDTGETAAVAVNTIGTLGTFAGDAGDFAFAPVDNTNMPGVYELHICNNALAAGADQVTISVKDAGSNNIAPLALQIRLTSADFDNGSLATEAKQDVIDTVVDDLKAALVILDTTIESDNRNKTNLQMAAGVDDDDQYIGNIAIFQDGGDDWYARVITDYAAANNVITWSTETKEDPKDGGTLYIIPGSGAVMRGTDGANTTTPPTVTEIQAEMEENGASILDTLRDDFTNDGRIDVLIDAIKAKTDNLPTDPADASVIAGLIGTAQADLDTITGANGVTLATTQSNYAPNKVVPDAAGVAPTA